MLINGTKFTFGADPELFVQKVSEKDTYFVGVDKFIRGSKEEPFPVKRGAVQVDGMAAEFNIDPVDNREDFVLNIKTVLRQLKGMLPEGHVLSASPVAEFSTEEWKKAPEQCRVLGCNPDYNAYTGEENNTPNAEVTFRTGAGHIHIGWGANFDKTSAELHTVSRYLCHFLDFYLGGPLSVVAADFKRRDLYGGPGCYRTTSFGMEYRTPSNFWLISEEMIGAVFDAIVLSVTKAFKPDDNIRFYKWGYQVYKDSPILEIGCRL